MLSLLSPFLSSLLEGICKTLDPNFKFVLVLRDILYNEGMLQELYLKEMNEFAQKSVISIEKGLDVLPLLKRALEERNGESRESKKLPVTVFLSAILIAMVLFSRIHPMLSYVIIIIDIILFAYTIKK